MPKNAGHNRVNQESQNLHRDFRQEQANLTNRFNTDASRFSTRGDAGYNQLQGNYTDMYNRARAGQYGGPRNYFTGMAENGGWDPAAQADITGDIGTLKDYAGNLTKWADNPIDAAGEARWRGGGVYDEAAKTGLVSLSDRQMMRSRGNSVTGSLASSLKQDLENQANVTGRPVSAAALSQGNRKLAQEAGNTAINTELGISDQVNQGRRWGAEGMTSSEAGLQGFKKDAKLGGYGLASENIRAAGGLQQNMQDSMQRGKMFGIEGLSKADQQNFQAEMYAVAGRAGLQQQDVQQYQSALTYLMQAHGMSAEEAQSYIQQQAQLNPKSNVWGTIGKVAQIVGAAAATYFTGGAASPLLGAAAGGGGGGGDAYGS